MRQPNAVYASSNCWGIPDLDIEMEARHLDTPAHAWRGPNSYLVKDTALWHFYTADKNFNKFRKDASDPLSTPAACCVECNFSIGEQTATAEVLYETMVKRHISRYWQAEGKYIVVDMHVPERFASINLIGVPPGWSTYASKWTDPRTNTIKNEDRLKFEINLARERAGRENIQFAVFGGGIDCINWCRENGAVDFPTYKEAIK